MVGAAPPPAASRRCCRWPWRCEVWVQHPAGQTACLVHTLCWLHAGVRSHQAKKVLQSMRVGDQALFYHSNAKPPGVVGVVEVSVGPRRPACTAAWGPQDGGAGPPGLCGSCSCGAVAVLFAPAAVLRDPATARRAAATCALLLSHPPPHAGCRPRRWCARPTPTPRSSTAPATTTMPAARERS